MKLLLTLYPEDTDVEQSLVWARAAGFEVDDFISEDRGRCVTIKGDVDAADLEEVVYLLHPRP